MQLKELVVGDRVYLHTIHHMAKYFKEDFGSYFIGTIIKNTTKQLHIDIEGTIHRFSFTFQDGYVTPFKNYYFIESKRHSTRVYNYSTKFLVEKVTKRLDKKYSRFFADTTDLYPNLKTNLMVEYNGKKGVVTTVKDGNLAGAPMFSPEGIHSLKHSETITHQKITDGIVVLGTFTNDHMFYI